jgi:2-oxoglutarate ferredoxin oxidoreductase subunit alpha
MSKRKVIKIAGESGMGIESSGMIVMKALKKSGFYVFGEREFPSLIKGGRANIQINYANKPVRSLSSTIDIALGLDREGLIDCLETLKEGGILIHGFERWNKAIKTLPKVVEEKKLQMIQIPAREIALENGGNIIMVNVVLLGYLWKVLGLDFESLKFEISRQFAKKPQFLEVNYACAKGGYDFKPEVEPVCDNLEPQNDDQNLMLIDGNSSLVIGAVEAGVRAYYGYPMSPSSSILSYIAQVADDYGIAVKQVEDEITVAQMTLGSMHSGTRALCATSGGGYDLMTETISLSAMIETPLVIINAQRPGPATGLPTWTGQSDLNLSIFSSHGEFSRCVIACSDNKNCYENIQHAFNIAEKYQIPVTVLTEATIAMSYTTIKPFEQDKIKIQRGHISQESELESIKQEDRYSITENGVSKRWLPGTSKSIYFANGDEHWSGGEITEDGQNAKEMIEKRNKKGLDLLKNLPEPELFGVKNKAQISFVGWGSTKRAILDALDIFEVKGILANYLHYNYVWPLKTDKFLEFTKENKNIILIEGNYEGQLGKLIERETSFKFENKVLKWDGRAFFVEDVLNVWKA